MAVFHFVVEQTKIHGKQPCWPTLLEQWNKEYPEGHEWHYRNPSSHRSIKSSWDNFKGDFRSAEKAVMNPPHRFPKRRVIIRLEEWQEEDLSWRQATAKRELNRMLDYLEGRDTLDD